MSKKNYVPDRKGSTVAHAHRAGKIAIAIIVLLLIGALVASVLTLGFTSFDLKKNFGKEEEPPITEAEEDTFIIEPVSSELVKIMPLTMAESPDMAAEEHTVRLTATVLPEGAPQEVKWTIAFTDPASEWATGKNVEDYVTLTKVQTEEMTDEEKANPYIVDVKGLQAFREQITITVASLHNEKAAATCLVDYAARYEGFNQIITDNKGLWSFKIKTNEPGTVLGNPVLNIRVNMSSFVADLQKEFSTAGLSSYVDQLAIREVMEVNDIRLGNDPQVNLQNQLILQQFKTMEGFEYGGLSYTTKNIDVNKLPTVKVENRTIAGRGKLVNAILSSNAKDQDWIMFLFGQNAQGLPKITINDTDYNKIADCVNRNISKYYINGRTSTFETGAVPLNESKCMYFELDFQSLGSTFTYKSYFGFEGVMAQTKMPYRATSTQVSQGQIIF